MTEFLQLDQDAAIVALFAGALVLSTVTIAVVAILRALGKWGSVALFAGATAVWMLR